MFHKFTYTVLLIVLFTLLGCTPGEIEGQAENLLVVPTATPLVDEATLPSPIFPTATSEAGEAVPTEPASTEIPATEVVVIPTATPAIPYLLTIKDMNVRSGPGVEYAVIGFMGVGSSAEVVGRAADAGWWRIACPAGATSDQCWISHKAAYTQAHNIDGVPVVAVPVLPPTTTPEPVVEATAVPTLAPEATEVFGVDGVADVGFVAFVSEGNLWTSDIYRPSGLIGMESPVQISSEGNLVGTPLVSPDGLTVAVLQQIDENPAVLVAITLATGAEAVIVDGALLPLPDSAEVAEDTPTFRTPYRFIWTHDSQMVVFNTTTTGYGLLVNDDLWVWSLLDGSLIERFAPGAGGGEFTINATNELILARAEAIDHVHLSGSGRIRMLDFDYVYTYSEYTYYPKPYWSADGATAYAAIPSQESLEPDAVVNLWEFSSAAPAVIIDTEPGNFLFRVAAMAGDDRIIAPPCTTTLDAYFGRNASGSHAMFSHMNEAARSIILVDTADDTCHEFPVDALKGIRRADWVMDDVYLIYTEQAAGGEFQAGVIGGPAIPLLAIDGSNTTYDVWLP